MTIINICRNNEGGFEIGPDKLKGVYNDKILSPMRHQREKGKVNDGSRRNTQQKEKSNRRKELRTIWTTHNRFQKTKKKRTTGRHTKNPR